jgi:TonB family protein
VAAEEPAPAAPVTVKGTIGGAPILEDPVVLGKLAKAAIEEPLAAVRPAVRACWEAVAAERPRGKVLVKLSVTPDGEVRRSRVLSTSLRHPEAEQCMLQAAEKARFPAFEGTEVALVTTPFVFP